IGAALPTLLGAVSRNAETEDGQAQLHQSLADAPDPDAGGQGFLGTITGMLGGVDDAEQPTNNLLGGLGESMLGNILGSRQSRVETGISKASGLSGGQTSSLLKMLAPLVMGTLGKRQRESNMSSGDLGGLLRREQEHPETAENSSFIGRMLDQDGDGDFDMMDVMKFGASRLFGRR
ncbi:MAG: DUF937 domain-containing protein, partial [Planctomycetota bacterium]